MERRKRKPNGKGVRVIITKTNLIYGAINISSGYYCAYENNQI